eukprot:Hpha_TRINITY_DN16750_c0_g2::TRINITY_DN16750_c0_g2_i1::g.79875::m.79875/K09568/FKBP1; FK506-binding protein 1
MGDKAEKKAWGIQFDEKAETNKAGDGKTIPQSGDQVEIHVICRLKKGETVAFSSREEGGEGKPQTKKIDGGGMVQGLSDALKRMSLGQRATVEIPSALAYRPGVAARPWAPHTDLVYDVELLKVN